MTPAGITAIDESTAKGAADLPPLDPAAYPDAEILAARSAPVDEERRMHPFEKLQRQVLASLDIPATSGSLMLCSDLLSSIARLEFVDPELVDDQAERLVRIREDENRNAPQMWGPAAIKIAKRGLELRLSGEADLLVPKAV